jgi:hypothetical protein
MSKVNVSVPSDVHTNCIVSFVASSTPPIPVKEKGSPAVLQNISISAQAQGVPFFLKETFTVVELLFTFTVPVKATLNHLVLVPVYLIAGSLTFTKVVSNSSNVELVKLP